MDITVTVYPEEGNFADVARGLLDAAEHPGQVRYVSHPRAGFIVPEEVFERFDGTQSTGQSSNGQEPPAGEPEPRKRRGGRVRKNLLTPEELAAAVAAGTPDGASKEE